MAMALHPRCVASLKNAPSPGGSCFVCCTDLQTRDVQDTNESIVQGITWASEQKMDIVVLVGLEKQEGSFKRLSSIAICFISEQLSSLK